MTDTGSYYFTSTDESGQTITNWWEIDSTMVQDWKRLNETNAVVAFAFARSTQSSII